MQTLDIEPWHGDGSEGRLSYGTWWWHAAVGKFDVERRGEATICTHLKTRRRAANEPQVVAIATNAKNGPSKLTTSEKGSTVMGAEEEDWGQGGEGKTPPLNILIKADSACKWPRQGRKWKQTAITKSKAAVIKYKKGAAWRTTQDCSGNNNNNNIKANGRLLWFCLLQSFNIKVTEKMWKNYWKLV